MQRVSGRALLRLQREGVEEQERWVPGQDVFSWQLMKVM